MVAYSFKARVAAAIPGGTNAPTNRADRERHERLSKMVRRHSHHRMCAEGLLGIESLVLPIGVSCIQPRMLANVHGGQKPEHQQERQGHGVGMPASSMDTDAAHGEEGREDQRDNHFARHRDHRRACRSRFFACRLTLEGSTKLHGVDVRGRPEHPDPRRQPLAHEDVLLRLWMDLRTGHCAHHDIDNRATQDHDEGYQGCCHRPRVAPHSIEKQTTGGEYRHQGERGIKDLHGLVNLRVNTHSCLCLLQRASDDRAPRCFLDVLEALLWSLARCSSRLVCQVTPHAKAVRRIGIRRPNPVGDRGSSFGHVRHAILRTNGRHSNGLRRRRYTDCQGGDCGEFIEGKHVALLRKKLKRFVQPSSEIMIIEIDYTVRDPIAGIPSAGGVFDLALAAFEEIDRFGPRVAEPIPQGVYRYSTKEEPVSVGHRKTHMLSRVRINNRGPARVTDDGHGRPLRLLSAPRKYPFHRQRIIELERTAIAKLYFAHARSRPSKIDELVSLIQPTLADGSSIIAFSIVLIRWQPLAPASELDNAGAA